MTSWTSLPTEEAFIMLRALGRVALTQVQEIQRQLRLAQASPPSRRSSNDETDSEWERHAL